jgi:rhodanese-related sulfurtransferase
MQYSRYIINFLFAGFILLLPGCADHKSGNREITKDTASTEVTPSPQSVTVDQETEWLLADLAQQGDYVNSREFPSLIKASVVYESLGSNIHLIDLRPSGQYRQGHIQGAVNKRFEELPAYFEAGIKPFTFDKIILVCADGQLSSYTVALLRLMGYGNTYAMRWGMGSWNKAYAEESWLKALSGKYESQLEQVAHEKPAPASMPELKTGLSSGEEIAAARFKELFAAGTSKILVSADEVFANPGQYYIINYERKDKYDDGHIPGSVRYKPNATLGIIPEMATIPLDKTVVIYCGTGHNSGFVTAYLRLFGYDARTLQYGNNGFMHDRMVKQNASLSWLPFSNADINDFPVVR